MRVLLGVTGCIGAYKAAEILRGLQRAGADVRVIMTRSATQFIQPLTFEALSGHPVIVEMFEHSDAGHASGADPAKIEHIAVARETDLFLIAPATANSLAKFAHGIADDFLSTVYLSNTNPVLVAPAMNVEMWNHAATQANLETLRERGVLFVEPGSGYQACGETGVGRLAEVDEIVNRALEILDSKQRQADLAGENILITAGPTVEDLDPVRYLTNRSSGKMGYALAAAAQSRGAHVTLVTGPTRLSPPAGVEMVSVRSTAEMYKAVMQRLTHASMFIGCAAVADFRPARRADEKLKKNGRQAITLELETTEDIIGAVGEVFANANGSSRKLLVGFAAESEQLLSNAEKKLREKRMDLIVANDISRDDAGFDTDNNAVTLIRRDGSHVDIPLASKQSIANRVLDEVVALKD